MNYYFFPLAPPLTTTVTLANFPPTTSSSWDAQSAFVYAAFSTGTDWKVFFIQKVDPEKTISFRMEDLPEQPPEKNSIFLFMYPKRLPERLDSLPVDQFMESDPNWRGNIQLRSETTAVSYQGEYPGFMLNLSKGTLLIFNPLIQNEPQGDHSVNNSEPSAKCGNQGRSIIYHSPGFRKNRKRVSSQNQHL